LNIKANASAAKMNALKARTLQYQQERQRNEARMRQPQNRAVLDRSQFLNAVFAQKSFSWTAVMMDLERVLPAGVQVTSIEPSTSKSGEVNIRLRVPGSRNPCPWNSSGSARRSRVRHYERVQSALRGGDSSKGKVCHSEGG
jgi:type IV pilus assembly protein PilN